MSLPISAWFASREELRQIDRDAVEIYGMHSLQLMENAGAGAAKLIHHRYEKGAVFVLCGSGNNAGDGFVIARHLQLFDRNVQIILLTPESKLSGDSLFNFCIARKSKLTIHTDGAAVISDLVSQAKERPIVVDAMLGTGASGPVRSPFSEAIRAVNAIDCIRVAIDLPTGMDCDTGAVDETTFRAHYTVTFAAMKRGFAKAGSSAWTGDVDIASIGAPACLLKEISELARNGER